MTRKTRTLKRKLLLPFSSVGLPRGRVAPKAAHYASDVGTSDDQIHPKQVDKLVHLPDTEVRTR